MEVRGKSAQSAKNRTDIRVGPPEVGVQTGPMNKFGVSFFKKRRLRAPRSAMSCGVYGCNTWANAPHSGRDRGGQIAAKVGLAGCGPRNDLGRQETPTGTRVYAGGNPPQIASDGSRPHLSTDRLAFCWDAAQLKAGRPDSSDRGGRGWRRTYRIDDLLWIGGYSNVSVLRICR
jgi:hypothetical protein